MPIDMPKGNIDQSWLSSPQSNQRRRLFVTHMLVKYTLVRTDLDGEKTHIVYIALFGIELL